MLPGRREALKADVMPSRHLLDRRAFLSGTTWGLSSIALAAMLEQQRLLGGDKAPSYAVPIDPAAPHAVLVRQLGDVRKHGEHADRAGDRGPLGVDRAPRGRNVVAARRGEGAHRHGDGLGPAGREPPAGVVADVNDALIQFLAGRDRPAGAA